MEQEKNGIRVALVCPCFVQKNVSINTLIGNGNSLNKDDEATKNGLPVSVFTSKMI